MTKSTKLGTIARKEIKSIILPRFIENLGWWSNYRLYMNTMHSLNCQTLSVATRSFHCNSGTLISYKHIYPSHPHFALLSCNSLQFSLFTVLLFHLYVKKIVFIWWTPLYKGQGSFVLSVWPTCCLSRFLYLYIASTNDSKSNDQFCFHVHGVSWSLKYARWNFTS